MPLSLSSKVNLSLVLLLVVVELTMYGDATEGCPASDRASPVSRAQAAAAPRDE